MKHLQSQKRAKNSQTSNKSGPLPRVERLPIFDQDVSRVREGVWRERGRAAAHKHPEAQVVPDSDRGLHGDEVAQVKHVGAPVVHPVVWNRTPIVSTCSRGRMPEVTSNPPVMSFMSKDRFSTAAWVDMKGIQVGLREELDRLYFLGRHYTEPQQRRLRDFRCRWRDTFHTGTRSVRRLRPFE